MVASLLLALVGVVSLGALAVGAVAPAAPALLGELLEPRRDVVAARGRLRALGALLARALLVGAALIGRRPLGRQRRLSACFAGASDASRPSPPRPAPCSGRAPSPSRDERERSGPPDCAVRMAATRSDLRIAPVPFRPMELASFFSSGSSMDSSPDPPRLAGADSIVSVTEFLSE